MELTNAECDNMERTSLTHLSTYMIAKNPACKPDFSHKEKENKYNPILKGMWDYFSQKKQLVAAINGIPCPEIDKVMTVEGVDGYWEAT